MSATNKGTTLVLAVVLSLAVAGAGGYMLGNRLGERNARMDQKPVATVNGETITESMLFDRLARQGGAQTVDGMISEMLVHQAAKEANATATDAELNKELAKLKAEMGGDEAFKKALGQAGMTEADVKTQLLSTQVELRKLLSKDIPTDDATLQAYLDKNLDRWDTKREAHARHILVATEEEAKAVKAELDKGADFATLALAKSTDKVANEKGGDLGSFTRGRMIAEFDDVVFTMTPGQISEPFQTQFGWHVVQLLEMKGELPKLADHKAEVTEAWVDTQVQEKATQWIEDQKAKAKIEYADKKYDPNQEA